MTGAKEPKEAWRVDVVVHDCGITAVRYVVHAKAERPAKSVEAEFAFDRRAQSHEIRKAVRVRSGDELAELVHGDKGKTGTPDHRVGKLTFRSFPQSQTRN